MITSWQRVCDEQMFHVLGLSCLVSDRQGSLWPSSMNEKLMEPKAISNIASLRE